MGGGWGWSPPSLCSQPHRAPSQDVARGVAGGPPPCMVFLPKPKRSPAPGPALPKEPALGIKVGISLGRAWCHGGTGRGVAHPPARGPLRSSPPRLPRGPLRSSPRALHMVRLGPLHPAQRAGVGAFPPTRDYAHGSSHCGPSPSVALRLGRDVIGCAPPSWAVIGSTGTAPPLPVVIDWLRPAPRAVIGSARDPVAGGGGGAMARWRR